MLAVLLAAMLMAAAFPVVATGSVSAQSAPLGEEFQITFEEHSQNQIEFWGDTVVYADHVNGQPQVWGFDLGGNSPFPVSTSTGSQNNASVYGDIIVHMKKAMVWEESDDEWEDVGDIWGYDRTTGVNFPICTDIGEQGNPFIWGSKVAWVDHRNTDDPLDGSWNQSDIFVYDLETEELVSFDASPTLSGYHAPVLYEDKLLIKVEDDWSLDGNGRLLIADLTTMETEVIPESEVEEYYYQDSPNLWGDYVVWQQYNYVDGWDIKVCDLTTMETEVICDTGAGGGVDVWENFVVWADDRNDSTDIFMWDIDTSTETTICANESEQGRPRIDNGTVVWVDERNADLMEIDNADIYGMYIAPQTAEFAGDDRYSTAVTASRKAFGDGADTVVIATGENWPDALAASGLAGAVGGPVLLVRSDSVPAVVVTELQRLGAMNAYLIGGDAAISAGVEADLNTLLGGEVTRIGGDDRYQTAGLVSEEAVSLLGAGFGGTAILASGVTSADAVASSALSAGLGMPLYLTPTDVLRADVKAMMETAGVTDLYIVGGPAVVTDGVKTAADAAFGTVERLSGDDRYETAIAIAEEGVALGLTWDGVGFAKGTDFPDALAGGVVQGKNGSVLLLTPSDSLNPLVKAALEDHSPEIGLVRFYGGDSAISQAVRDAIFDAVEQL